MADAISDVRRGRVGKWRSLRARVTASSTSGTIDVGMRRVVFAAMSAVNASSNNSIRLTLNTSTPGTTDGVEGNLIAYSAAASGGVYEVYAEGV